MIWTSTFPLIREQENVSKHARVQICDKIQHLKYLGCVRNRFPYNRRCFPQSGNQRIRLFSLRTVRYPLPDCRSPGTDDVEAINGIHGELANDDKVTVAVVAPAVRAAWGENLVFPRNLLLIDSFVSTLKSVGFELCIQMIVFAASLNHQGGKQRAFSPLQRR